MIDGASGWHLRQRQTKPSGLRRLVILPPRLRMTPSLPLVRRHGLRSPTRRGRGGQRRCQTPAPRQTIKRLNIGAGRTRRCLSCCCDDRCLVRLRTWLVIEEAATIREQRRLLREQFNQPRAAPAGAGRECDAARGGQGASGRRMMAAASAAPTGSSPRILRHDHN
jgi:hypothetical protein